MQDNNSTPEPMIEAPVQDQNPQLTVHPNNKIAKTIGLLLISFLLIISAAFGGYFVRDKSALDSEKTKDSEIESLKTQLATSQSQIAAKAEAATTRELVISAIKAAVNSNDTNTIEKYASPNITLTLAMQGDQYTGPWTSTNLQTVAKMDAYIFQAKSPWNFSLSEAVRDSYSVGNYDQYLPSDVIVGKSIDNKVVAFTIDSNSKITKIFFAANEDWLIDKSITQ